MYGLSLGAVTLGSIVASGRMTGGCINPLRVFGPSILRGNLLYYIKMSN